jgi:hypothetical protein
VVRSLRRFEAGHSEILVERKRARNSVLAHHLKANEVDERDARRERRKQSGNACRMRGFVDPDGAQHRDELVYETPDRDLPEAAVCNCGGLDENVAVRYALLVLERGERPLGFVMKPVITVEQRVER